MADVQEILRGLIKDEDTAHNWKTAIHATDELLKELRMTVQQV